MKQVGQLIAVATVWMSQGCFIEADRGPATGTLTAEWSIAGYADPRDCDDNRASYFDLVLYDSFDRYVAEVEAPCDYFNVSIDLPDGIYNADATLLDAFGRAATVTLLVTQLDVRGGTELIVPIDFGYRSIL